MKITLSYFLLLIALYTTFSKPMNNMTGNENNKLMVRSSDGHQFKVEQDLIILSTVLKDQIEYSSGDTVELGIKQEEFESISPYLLLIYKKEIPTLGQKLQELTPQQLADIITISDYLNIPQLLRSSIKIYTEQVKEQFRENPLHHSELPQLTPGIQKIIAQQSITTHRSLLEWLLNHCNKTVQQGRNAIYAICFSPDETHVAIGTYDGMVRIYNVETGNLSHTLQRHTKAITTLRFNRGGTMFATGSRDNKIQLWHATLGTHVRELQGHTDEITALAFGPHDLVSGSKDTTVQIWESNTGILRHVLRGHTKPITSIDINPEGTLLATASNDCTVQTWNLQTGTHVHTATYPYAIKTIRFNNDGKLRGISTIGTVTNGQQVKELQQKENDLITFADLDSGKIVTGLFNGELRVYNTKRTPQYTLHGHEVSIYTAAFNNNETQIVTGSLDGTAKVWNLKNIHRCKKDLQHINLQQAHMLFAIYNAAQQQEKLALTPETHKLFRTLPMSLQTHLAERVEKPPLRASLFAAIKSGFKYLGMR